MQTDQKGATILAAILFNVHRIKPLFDLGPEFDKCNSYMKVGGNPVIND